MSDGTSEKSIILKSNDGAWFLVPETWVKQSQTICHMIEAGNTMNISHLVLPDVVKAEIDLEVTAPILSKVIVYCNKHFNAADELKHETTEQGNSTTPVSSRLSNAADASKIDMTKEGNSTTLASSRISNTADALKTETTKEGNGTTPATSRISNTANASKTEMTKEGSRTRPASSRISAEELRNWDKQFLDVDRKTLLGLENAADYLKIQGLRDAIKKRNSDSDGKYIRDRVQDYRVFIPKWLL